MASNRGRDRRDPQVLGEAYLRARKLGASIEDAVSVPVRAYEDGTYMSADPADHHSKTRQDISLQEPGDSA